MLLKKKNIKNIFFLFFVLTSALSFAQVVPSYDISNFTAYDCRAKFYDDGGMSAPYLTLGAGAGGSYTFQIITGNPVINMTFDPDPLKTQIIIGDTIRFYKGFPLDITNQIGSFYTNVPTTGVIPPITSLTGSLIVVWKENGNTKGIGWDAQWSSPSIPPIPPTATVSPVPVCSATSIMLNVTNAVLCDSLLPKYFFVTGPMFPGVSGVSAVPCSSGTTTAVRIDLINPLNKNCTYTITSTLFRKDKCDSVHKFPNIVSTFSINNCPIQASITALPSNTVCAYKCNASLRAVSPATTCLTFTYLWDNGLPPTAGPHTVCPVVTTVYNCTMTEVMTLIQTVVSQTVYVIDPQINAIPSNTVCQSAGNINLTATPPGGLWSGPGISVPAIVTGVFNPYLSGPGTFSVVYNFGGCTDTIKITVLELNPGADDAACTGGPTFTVSGGLPLGGIWGGSPYISASGSFTPSAAGSHTVSYTAGGCTGIKTVNVDNLLISLSTQTICQSQPYLDLFPLVTPFGGRYFGVGIINNVLGRFDPSLSGPGNFVVTYSLANGCNADFTVTVLPIYAVPAATTCPSHVPFTVPTATPGGGAWSGTGITNPVTGMYDPSVGGLGDHTDNLIYTGVNGCKDTIKMAAIVTRMAADSIFTCDSYGSIMLDNYPFFNYYPLGGVFSSSSPGLVFFAGNYYFNPALAGAGIHTVFYTANTCFDSIKMVVYPSVLIGKDSTVCSTHPPFIIARMPIGTTWTGIGIINTSTGLFDPSSTGPGTFVLNYTNRAGCGNSVTMIVYPFIPAGITGLGSNYCYTNTDHVFTTAPVNGTLTTSWAPTTYTFNSSVIGAGTHNIKYAIGKGVCYTSKSLTITVHPALTTTLNISKTAICIGESSRISVAASGGLPTVPNYTYTWANGLISINTHTVFPTVTTVYTVTTSDNCSDPKTDTVRIRVHPNFYPSLTLSQKKCYYDNGFAKVDVTPIGTDYTYKWNSVPVQTTPMLNGYAGKYYTVKITNTVTGCSRDTTVKIPGYDPIKALFSPDPNLPCIPFDHNLVTFIDLSNGATSGYWNFDGNIATYTVSQSAQYLFNKPGTFYVTLTVANDGNCRDSISMPICIYESPNVIIPELFSPNNDNKNDVWEITYLSHYPNNNVQVMNRWGDEVFKAKPYNNDWNGSNGGSKSVLGKGELPAGTYYYILDLGDGRKPLTGYIQLVK